MKKQFAKHQIIKRELKDVIETLYRSTNINYEKYRFLSEQRYLQRITQEISSEYKIDLGEFSINLIEIKGLTGKLSWTVLPFWKLPRPKRPHHKDIKAIKESTFHYWSFVGHRFIDKITKNLRYNLSELFQAYKIEPKYIDLDDPTGMLFDGIISEIENSDFCLFDTRETENRPNVFIEMGISYAKNKPFFLCEYIKDKPAIKSIPSNLSGLQRLSYKTYRELCQKLSILLPRFLKKKFINK